MIASTRSPECEHKLSAWRAMPKDSEPVRAARELWPLLVVTS